MDEDSFFHYRNSFRNLMTEKTLGEIRASKNVFLKLMKMTEKQLGHLIDDLLLLEDYKLKHPTVNEEFNRIVEGYYR